MSHRTVHVRLINGPSVVLEIDGLRAVVDPTFDEPGRYEFPDRTLVKTAGPALQPHDIGPVDFVLASHNHVDNLDRAGREFLRGVPLVLTTADTAASLGGTCRAVELWEQVELPCPDGGTLRVTRVPARHGPPGTEDRVGDVAGFVLECDDGPVVYVSGDNVGLDAVQAVADRFGRVDVAILCAGAARTALIDADLTLNAGQTVEAARLLPGAAIVVVHLDSWAHVREGRDDVRAAWDAAADAALRRRLVLLEPGGDVTVGDGKEM